MRSHARRSILSFSVFSDEVNNGGHELLVNSGCNGFMIKDKELFYQLDEQYSSSVGNANASKSDIMGTGTLRCLVDDFEGNVCIVELKMRNGFHDIQEIQYLSGS